MSIKSFLISLYLLVGFGPIDKNEEIFTIYLVRHSEKTSNYSFTKDIPLSKCGQQRSEALGRFLNDIHLDAIYSTDYTRTINTALPTAHLKGIEITLYNTENLKSLSKTLLDKRQDALVIGHSNTTGVLAGLLANEEIEDIDLDVYDHIYQLVICGKSRRLNLFKSSFKCDT